MSRPGAASWVLLLSLAGCQEPLGLGSPDGGGTTTALRLSDTATPSVTFLNNASCIAVDATGAIHVAWLEILQPGSGDGLATRGQLFHTRSLDGGASFSTPAPLTAEVAQVGPPKLASAGGTVVAVWHQGDGGLVKIFAARSDDRGATWSTLAAPLGAGSFPGIAARSDGVNPAQVHVVWNDPQSVSQVSEVYLASSSDGGRSFSARVPVSTDDGRSSWTAAVAFAGPVVHVAWTDERHNVDQNGAPYDCGTASDGAGNCREEEYYRRSTDGGRSFTEPEVRLTVDPDRPIPSLCPSIVAESDDVHIAYFDPRSGTGEVFHRRSRDAGLTWEPEVSLTRLLATTPSGNWQRPSLALRDGALAMTFWTDVGGSDSVWATGSSDGGTTWSPARRLSTGPDARHPAIAMGPTGPAHVAWYQTTDGNQEMFYSASPD